VVECPEHVVLHSAQLDAVIGDGGQAVGELLTNKVPAGCRVVDANVYLAVAHEDAGDLVARLVLENADGLESRTLFSGICDGEANVIVSLDDEAVAPVGSTCPAIGGTYTTAPVGQLNGFDGESAQGRWRLEVADTAVNGQTGQLLNWTLDLYTEGVPEPQGNP
jgi:hypothetical protein